MTQRSIPRTVWMNVTTSANWNRPAVGIVRVEQAICRELERIFSGDTFKRCVWDGSHFSEWLGNIAQDTTSNDEIFFHTPFPSSRHFDPLRSIISKSRKLSLDKIEPNSGNFLTEIDQTSRPKFGDVLISVGLDWDHEYFNEFYRMKNICGIKIVTCCYDLIPVLFPQFCVGEVASHFKNYFSQVTWGTSAMLCISEQTQRDYVSLCASMGAPIVPTAVIPLGDNLPSASKKISADVAALAEEPFVLFVSTIERRKNHEILYRAYHLLCRQGHKAKLPRLVFVGMPGWGVTDFLKDVELDPQTAGLIVQLNHVTDADLAHLYKHALFCLFPSLYEGWGLPVGEALAMGKAVLASDQGSLPEVGGDLVRYIDPWNATAWADTIMDLIDHPAKIHAMETQIRTFYRQRDWTDTSLVISHVIESLDSNDAFPLKIESGYDLQTDTGIRCGSEILSTAKEGLFINGPGRSLPPGAYDLLIDIRNVRSWSGELDFMVVSDRGKSLYGQKLLGREASKSDIFQVSVPFVLQDAVEDFELRCLQKGDVQVALGIITISRALGNPGRVKPLTEA